MKYARTAYDDCKSKNKGRGQKKRETKLNRNQNNSITNENALKSQHERARVCNSSQFRKLVTSPSCLRCSPLNDTPNLEAWESEVDDGSEYKPGVNDYNIDLEGTNVDSTYDPAFMEEDKD